MCTKEEYEKGDKIIKNKYHLFKGRIQKLCSVVASYCSVSFYKNFNGLFDENKIPHFDCRVLVFNEDKKYEIVNHMIWRKKDC